MNFFTSSPSFRLSKGSLIFLHVALPIIFAALIAAYLYCIAIAKNDAFFGEYLFYEAIEYVLASLLISYVGAILIDIIERDQKMR